MIWNEIFYCVISHLVQSFMYITRQVAQTPRHQNGNSAYHLSYVCIAVLEGLVQWGFRFGSTSSLRVTLASSVCLFLPLMWKWLPVIYQNNCLKGSSVIQTTELTLVKKWTPKTKVLGKFHTAVICIHNVC